MPSKHGTISGYHGGCRCAECTEAARLNRKAKRQAADGRPGWPGICVEAKSGGGKLDLPGWLAELAREVRNSQATHGFVAIRPRGKPDPTDWYAVMPLPALVALLDEAGWIR